MGNGAELKMSDSGVVLITGAGGGLGSALVNEFLAQGWRDAPEVQRRSNVKVVVAMLIVLLTLVGVSLLFLFTVGDAFTDMIGGVFSK